MIEAFFRAAESCLTPSLPGSKSSAAAANGGPFLGRSSEEESNHEEIPNFAFGVFVRCARSPDRCGPHAGIRANGKQSHSGGTSIRTPAG